MTGGEPVSWGALALAAWPLWVAYGVVAVVGLMGVISGRKL